MYLVIKRSDGGTSVRTIINSKKSVEEEISDWEARPRSQANGWSVVSYKIAETIEQEDIASLSQVRKVARA